MLIKPNYWCANFINPHFIYNRAWKTYHVFKLFKYFNISWKMLEIDSSSMSQNISKAQGHKSIMDAHNLWAQRQNFIKRYDMILSLKSQHVLRNTSSLSLNTARHGFCKMQSSITQWRSHMWTWPRNAAVFSGPKCILNRPSKSRKVFCHQTHWNLTFWFIRNANQSIIFVFYLHFTQHSNILEFGL